MPGESLDQEETGMASIKTIESIKSVRFKIIFSLKNYLISFCYYNKIFDVFNFLDRINT